MPLKKPTNWKMIGKMVAVGLGCCIGGPALVIYVTPTPEELFSRYNPDLQKRSLANREKKQEEFDHFAMRLREYSKNDKPIWLVAADDEKKEKEMKMEQIRRRNEKQNEDNLSSS
ncbi:Assembly factor cbp4 [Golovinomyces cichoracearum]|uniref:Cytochrome b mRNA-processing protein 4 n=1 Tax=Golovinomyces cichoracearum TaxID=62708 RepID=A0A420IWD1_9PEZI|nr:Assembly factor cbp4 [Golovinomyces cichoracearum]